MDIDEFLTHIKQTKKSNIRTGCFNVKCLSNREHTKQKLYRSNICKHCKTETTQGIEVSFKEPHKMTIFEAELLFAIFYLKKKPVDFSSYYKCIAGKRFIENIKEIKGGEKSFVA